MSFTVDRVARVANCLRLNLSQDSQILTDPTDPGFQDSMKRWSSIDLQIPSAIIKPSCEEDIIKIVASATKEDIPFVAKAGGNSPWSTIGAEGWIIDLSLLREIKVDVEKQTATFSAAVIAKDVNEAVSKAGFCIQSAAFSRIGQIPFLLGGGSSALSGKYGIGSDNVLSFRLVTATRGLVVASETENPDLFWALKGAGQFFGIVTQATMRIFPLEHSITQWVCIFPPTQVKEVAAAIEAHANGPNSMLSSGFAGITAAPGQSKPIILVSTSHFRPASEVDEMMAPLLALKPLQSFRKTIDFGNITDSAESHNKQGGLKTHISCGMQRWESEKFIAGLDAWNKLVDEYPDAKGSVFMCNWISTEGMRGGESAWSHRDCVAWPMWFTPDVDETTAQVCMGASEAHISFCQKDQTEDEKALFPNHSRVLSLAQRYRGKERQEKLRSLKDVWDPKGVFTRQFL